MIIKPETQPPLTWSAETRCALCQADISGMSRTCLVVFGVFCYLQHITSHSPRELLNTAALEKGKCFNLSLANPDLCKQRKLFRPGGFSPRSSLLPELLPRAHCCCESRGKFGFSGAHCARFVKRKWENLPWPRVP